VGGFRNYLVCLVFQRARAARRAIALRFAGERAFLRETPPLSPPRRPLRIAVGSFGGGDCFGIWPVACWTMESARWDQSRGLVIFLCFAIPSFWLIIREESRGLILKLRHYRKSVMYPGLCKLHLPLKSKRAYHLHGLLHKAKGGIRLWNNWTSKDTLPAGGAKWQKIFGLIWSRSFWNWSRSWWKTRCSGYEKNRGQEFGQFPLAATIPMPPRFPGWIWTRGAHPPLPSPILPRRRYFFCPSS